MYSKDSTQSVYGGGSKWLLRRLGRDWEEVASEGGRVVTDEGGSFNPCQSQLAVGNWKSVAADRACLKRLGDSLSRPLHMYHRIVPAPFNLSPRVGLTCFLPDARRRRRCMKLGPWRGFDECSPRDVTGGRSLNANLARSGPAHAKNDCERRADVVGSWRVCGSRARVYRWKVVWMW